MPPKEDMKNEPATREFVTPVGGKQRQIVLLEAMTTPVLGNYDMCQSVNSGSVQ